MGNDDDGSGTEVVRTLLRGFNDRDDEALLGCLTEDVRWHVAGDNPLAGSYEGRDHLWERHLQPLWPSPARIEDDDVIEHGDHVVLLGREVHDFGDGEGAWDTVQVFRVDDGRIAERWAFTAGQDELDGFLTRGCAAALDGPPWPPPERASPRRAADPSRRTSGGPGGALPQVPRC